MKRWWFSTALIGLLALTLPLSGCGRKTMPVPPQEAEPARISDLRHRLDERGAELLWTVPGRTGSGRKLPTPVNGFEIYRAEIPEDRYCAGCPIPFGLPVRYEGAPPQPGETLRHQETSLRPGHRYFFKVRPRLGWYQRGPASNVISFSWAELPGPPQTLTVTSGDRQLSLAWSPPLQTTHGTGIDSALQYQVYRGHPGEELKPLGPPVTATSLADEAVHPGQHYQYQVRSLRQVNESVLAGPASSAAFGSPTYQAPLSPPRNLTAMNSPQGVLLVWQAPPEPNLAGFRIYRRSAAAPEGELLGQIDMPAARFVDEQAPVGQPLLYTVIAVDQADPPHESPPSQTVEIIP